MHVYVHLEMLLTCNHSPNWANWGSWPQKSYAPRYLMISVPTISFKWIISYSLGSSLKQKKNSRNSRYLMISVPTISFKWTISYSLGSSLKQKKKNSRNSLNIILMVGDGMFSTILYLSCIRIVTKYVQTCNITMVFGFFFFFLRQYYGLALCFFMLFQPLIRLPNISFTALLTRGHTQSRIACIHGTTDYKWTELSTAQII